MKNSKTVLLTLLAVGILAAAILVVVLPIQKQKEEQNREVLEKAEQQTFETATQNEKIQQNPLAKSLFQNKQHILLAGESGYDDNYARPLKTKQEILDVLQPCYEQVTAGTPLPKPNWEIFGEEVIPAGTRLGCPYYGIHDDGYDTWYYTACDPDTGALTNLSGMQGIPLSESADLLEAIRAQTLASQLAAQYLQMLGFDAADFAAPEPKQAIEALLGQDYSDEHDVCLLYNPDYELYACCALRANIDSSFVYLQEDWQICSLNPEEMRKAVE